MKIEITMTDGVLVTQDTKISFDEYINTLRLSKGFIMLRSTSNADIAINVDRIITVREVK